MADNQAVDDRDETQCVECGEHMDIPPGYDPTERCHACAQKDSERFRRLLENVSFYSIEDEFVVSLRPTRRRGRAAGELLRKLDALIAGRRHG